MPDTQASFDTAEAGRDALRIRRPCLPVEEVDALARKQGEVMQEVGGSVCDVSGVQVLQAQVDEVEGKRWELQAQFLKSVLSSVLYKTL